jgi:hypothetical protein
MSIEHHIELTEGELVSGLWVKMRMHLQARLELLRRQNDNTQSEAETADLRGRIAELKRLIAIGDKK